MRATSAYRDKWAKLGSEEVSVLPKLNEFKPNEDPQISLFSTVSIYGKRKSGKSVFIKWFLQFYKTYYPWYWVFTLTQLNSFYESFVAENFIIPEFDAEMMEAVMERQKVARRMAEEQLQQKMKEVTNPRAVVIWDDYNGSDIRYNNTLARYYYTGRHYQTLNLFGAQHITLTPPAIRSNTDLVIMFNTDYADSLEHYWRDFAGKMPKEMFWQLFSEATSEPHSFLAINNDPNVEYEHKFYKGMAEVLDEGPQWIVGCPEMWEKNIEQLKDIFAGKYIERAKISGMMAQPDTMDKLIKKCNPPQNPDILSFSGSRYA
jgi:hypothetical protein